MQFLSRTWKFTNPDEFLELKQGTVINDVEDLNKAIALLKQQFTLADGKTIYAEVWTPIVPSSNSVARLKPKKEKHEAEGSRVKTAS